jgi:N-methylhydantoinase B
VTGRELDPITVDLVCHALVGVAEETKVGLMRSAYNPIIYEVLDFATGVFDARGRLAAQASGLSIFLGTLDWAVQAVVRKFDGDIGPGDVYLTNDPYGGGGTHLNDVCTIAPAFAGDRLVGFVGSRAHWNDVGGAVPLSVQTDARDIHGEGLVLPVVRLMRRGQVNRDLSEVLRANVRLTNGHVGDLDAQISANNVGIRRLVELVTRYGADMFAAAVEAIHDRTERAVAGRLRELPDVVAEGEDHLDDDGIGGPPTRIRVRAEKRDDRLTLDFAGSAPANPSGYNMSLVACVSAARVIFKALVDPQSPANDGSFRALTVRAPAGSVVNARRPTPVSLYGAPARRAIDAVWRALIDAVGGRLPAGHYGTIAGLAMAGRDDRGAGEPVYAEYQGPHMGGWGAGPLHDGESAMCCVTNGDTRNTPVEIIEATSPLHVHRYELRPDSGGPGRWRGGLGTRYEFEILTGAPFAMTAAVDRTAFAAFGSHGGADGATNDLRVLRDGRLHARVPRTTAYPLRRGDRVVLDTGGGGGWGDPAERDRDALLRDVRAGYVTAGAARSEYGAPDLPDDQAGASIR